MSIWKRNLIICWLGTFATGIGLSQIAPVLPLYIDSLGVHDPDQIAALSGLSFGITFIVSAFFSPIWGMVGDKFGYKLMLLRVSLGMSLVIFSFAFAPSAIALTVLRALQGIISGYSTACITLIVSQTEEAHTGYALGLLSSASISGALIGPVFAGMVAEHFSIKATFFATSFLLFFVFVLTLSLVKEDFVKKEKQRLGISSVWSNIPQKSVIISLFITFFVISCSNFSVEPIMTMYVSELLTDKSHLALISGVVFSIAGLAGAISGPNIGKLSDKVGSHKTVLFALLIGGALFIPQAFVRNVWHLAILRFFSGIAMSGMMPGANATLSKITPSDVKGTVFGYSYSAHYLGVFSGSVLGGQIASIFKINIVFLFASILMLLCAINFYYFVFRRFNNKDTSQN